MYVTGQREGFKNLQKNPDVYVSSMAWLRIVEDEETLWSNFKKVKQFDPSVEFDQPYTVFSLRGDEYRIITEINYKARWVEIIGVWTFVEYKQYGANSLVASLKKVRK